MYKRQAAQKGVLTALAVVQAAVQAVPVAMQAVQAATPNKQAMLSLSRRD